MISLLLLAIAGALVAGYWLAPAPYVQAALCLQRRMAGLATRQVFVEGHRIVYSEGGKGPALLMLHGFGATRDNWLLLAKALTPHYRVIAPDLPGYGESDQQPAASYSLDAQLARLEAFTRALDLTPFHLAGNSMGGYLAGHFARRHPERVSSLWLIAPAGVITARQSEVMVALERGENPLLVRSVQDFEQVIDLCFVHPPYIPRQFKKVFARRSMRNAQFHAELFRALFEHAQAFEENLAGLTVPTLVTWGERDRILDASGGPILHALIPGSELRMMPDTGHVPMMERPRETAAQFLAFQRSD